MPPAVPRSGLKQRLAARRVAQWLCLALFAWLFVWVSWPFEDGFRSDTLERKEWLPAELFLQLDPLAAFSAAIAAREANPALWFAGGVLLFCLFVPRGFCGWICPLGTIIDGMDWLAAQGRRRWRRKGGRQRLGASIPAFDTRPIARHWRGARFAILAFLLALAAAGINLAGTAAAIPLLTRGAWFTAGRWQFGALRGWNELPPWTAGMTAALAILALALAGALARRRLWCRCFCPSGALISLFSALRLAERRVAVDCSACGQCRKVCSFGAVEEDFGAQALECAYCQRCGAVCPAGAISYRWRWRRSGDSAPLEASPAGRSLSRRAWLGSALGGLAAAAPIRLHRGAIGAPAPLRPPGVEDERRFLELCVRCGECFKVCPGPVLHPMEWRRGLEALWTPEAIPERAGCHPECNFCGQVCPTGAIPPLPLSEKKRARMGLAKIDASICLPHAGNADCRLCADECRAAGYNAIEMREIQLNVGDVPEGALSMMELEEMARIEAPFVLAEACVGCGLCEYRCHAANVRQQLILDESAIRVYALSNAK